VLIYNTDAFKGQAPTSWSVVFEEQALPDGKSNKGRVQAYAGAIYIADAALYLMAKKPELGIKDPYELNEDQYKAVLGLLRGQKPLVQRYWHDATVQTDDFTNEGVVASGSWPYQVNLLQGNKKPIASVIPAEGATGWADTTMMHVKAAHPNCAYMWLQHSLEPKVQGDVAALVRLGAGGSRRLQGQRPPDRYRLRHQRHGEFRQDQVLEDADRQMRQRGRLRALFALGERLHRHRRRPMTSEERRGGLQWLLPSPSPFMGSTATSVLSAPWTGSTSRSSPASSSRCSARLARARPPASG
jgi:hypothetical protein